MASYKLILITLLALMFICSTSVQAMRRHGGRINHRPGPHRPGPHRPGPHRPGPGHHPGRGRGHGRGRFHRF
ncbi:unnamed protein product [Cylicocyclus nassatus]|uniref:Uncharacterized protein n=1 Tax=Cylicocyclus nassatus TaxID=53992 RepID=A0AA36GST9_CYLNA|nr:unnamed protein product [Cylicocyclus nassatus]CAJ0597552.1 unnamed protein product [Cylicocyclus nassatus]